MVQDKSWVITWVITDTFWEAVKDIIPKPTRSADKEYTRRPGGGRKPMDPRLALAAIFYVLRTGIQWKALPSEYGSSSAVHRYFMKWSKAGVFKQMWSLGLAEYNELKGIQWEWQSIDGSNVKSPLAQEEVGANPTDRG